jgi:hypothetical protein
MISCNKRFGLFLGVAAAGTVVAAGAPVSQFSAVSNCSPIDVAIQAGSDYDVSFEGSPENVKYAGATVKGGTLYIQNEAFNPAEGSQSVVAIVTVPKDALTSIASVGSGDISASGLEAPSFSVASDGSGDIDLDIAVSGELNVNSNGSGDLTVGGSSDTATVSSNGSGDISVFGVAGDGSVSSNGSGDVYVGASAASTISGSNNGSGDLSYGGGGTCTVKGCEADEETFEAPSMPRPRTITGTVKWGNGVCSGVPFTPSTGSSTPTAGSSTPTAGSSTPTAGSSAPPASSGLPSHALEAMTVLSTAAAAMLL